MLQSPLTDQVPPSKQKLFSHFVHIFYLLEATHMKIDYNDKNKFNIVIQKSNLDYLLVNITSLLWTGSCVLFSVDRIL